MLDDLSTIRIVDGPFPLIVSAIAVFLFLALLPGRKVQGKSRARWALVVSASAVAGVAAGILLSWITSDWLDLFGVSLSVISRAWICASLAGCAVAVASLVVGPRWRRVVGAISIPVFALVGAVGVNADFGEYTTIASLAGDSTYGVLPAGVLSAQTAAAADAPHATAPLWESWKAPSGMPSHGVVGSVDIPATISHFAARSAYVYLPPAALVAHPPRLPVLLMLSGQPGSPQNVFESGRVDRTMDAFAAAHNGLAPIVVVPDQLSAPTVNPMCVDSVVGNSATYLTVDVPAWITAHLAVAPAPTSWGIGGFSQGGTCSIQLGAGHPELFSAVINIAGELTPKIGSVQETIAGGFAGDEKAYTAALPLTLLAAHHYTDTTAVFGAGALDTRYSPGIATVADAAKAAGMSVSVLSSPGTAHDWHTVKYVLNNGLGPIYEHFGLVKSS